MDHNPAAQVPAKMDQRLDVRLCFVADGLIRMREVQPGRTGEQPVQADDFDACAFGGFANVPALFGRDVRHTRRQCKGRDFHAITADFRGVVKDPLDFPVFKKFIAHGEFHDVVLSVDCAG